MDFTPEQLETARKFFAAEWEFVAGAANEESLPPMQGVEIAFAGRSNVGKSSLVNALTGHKALARVSDTPGRTQQINFFSNPHGLVLADLPGYGYAKVSKEKVAAWTGLVRTFALGRANLARVFVLVDSRHGLKEVDKEIMTLLDKAAVSYAVVLTKIDTLKTGEAEMRVAETAEAISRRPAAFPVIFPTSSQANTGLPELKAAILRVLDERKQKRN